MVEQQTDQSLTGLMGLEEPEATATDESAQPSDDQGTEETAPDWEAKAKEAEAKADASDKARIKAETDLKAEKGRVAKQTDLSATLQALTEQTNNTQGLVEILIEGLATDDTTKTTEALQKHRERTQAAGVTRTFQDAYNKRLNRLLKKNEPVEGSPIIKDIYTDPSFEQIRQDWNKALETARQTGSFEDLDDVLDAAYEIIASQTTEKPAEKTNEEDNTPAEDQEDTPSSEKNPYDLSVGRGGTPAGNNRVEKLSPNDKIKLGLERKAKAIATNN